MAIKLCLLPVAVVVVAVFGSDLYCFSCFGFTGEDSWKDDQAKSAEKCESRDGGFLAVRKCTTNSTKLPACVKFKTKYQLPQMMGNRLVERFVEAQGVHCGTRRQRSMKECPNYWPNDIKNIKDCEIDCCSYNEFSECRYPIKMKLTPITRGRRKKVANRLVLLWPDREVVTRLELGGLCGFMPRVLSSLDGQICKPSSLWLI